MALHDSLKHTVEEQVVPPIQRFRADRLAKKETVLKQEIESYYVSDVDNTAAIMLGRQMTPIACTLDLPDAICDGLTFKQRLVQTSRGDCLLIARWKPDRHMRRNAPEWSQKWFVEKQVFPPDNERLFSRLEKRIQEVPPPEPGSPPISAVVPSDDGEAAALEASAGTEAEPAAETDGDAE